ncbi:MAG: hypothetical protein AAF632_00345 [Bacteroidota bacterium]
MVDYRNFISSTLRFLLLLITLCCSLLKVGFALETDSIPGVRKVKDILIYQDSLFYASFPSVVKLPNGEYLLAFRRAPNRQVFGEYCSN